MNRRWTMLPVLAVLLVGIASPAAEVETLESVLKKHHDARGGLERLTALRTLRMAGKVVGPDGAEAPFVFLFKRPDMLRTEVTLRELTTIHVYDGETGWFVNPFGEDSSPRPMTAEQIAEMARQADLDGELIEHEKKGHSLEYVGRRAVDGVDAHEIRVIRNDGEVHEIFLEPRSYLEVKRIVHGKYHGQTFTMSVVRGDHREVDGLMFPFSLEQGNRKTVLETIEVNPEIGDALFVMPGSHRPEMPRSVPNPP